MNGGNLFQYVNLNTVNIVFLMFDEVVFGSAVAFVFNWVGLLASLCINHTVAGRFGAISGFGLSMVKWVLIVKVRQSSQRFNGCLKLLICCLCKRTPNKIFRKMSAAHLRFVLCGSCTFWWTHVGGDATCRIYCKCARKKRCA